MTDKIPTETKYNACLATTRTWAQRLAFVAAETRAVLSAFGHGRVVSTKDLIELLYPEQLARGTDSHLARKSIGKLLRALATGELADCARRGATVRIYGKPVQIWEWGCPQTSDGLPVFNPEYVERPTQSRACPHCGGSL